MAHADWQEDPWAHGDPWQGNDWQGMGKGKGNDWQGKGMKGKGIESPAWSQRQGSRQWTPESVVSWNGEWSQNQGMGCEWNQGMDWNQYHGKGDQNQNNGKGKGNGDWNQGNGDWNQNNSWNATANGSWNNEVLGRRS